ncbi:hypothetical protein [Saccharothrix xinjiangensis]|uniref:Uncharacterized protein n=1 Tax=Saccharothrix xinjiangensis TaxID=204798 RepID=A0ABV9XPG9_9PSEU
MSIYDRSRDKNQHHTARELPRIPGSFVLDVHGSPDAARVGRYPLSPGDVADVTRANPDWSGDPITLVGCETGRRDDGFAARLARELGVPVTAPNTDAWVDYDGNLFASDAVDGENPGWPPNGEWRTFGPDGSQDVSESPYPPGRNPMTDADRRPHERTLSTARYRSDRTGESEDFYNYSGKAHDWSPAAEAPQRPPRNERVFETSYARSYDPVSGGWREGEGGNRVHDSEPKMSEDLARHQLAEHSGLSRSEVDRALREAAKVVDTIDKADEDHYRNGFRGEVQRTRDRIELAIGELNERAAAQAAKNGTHYTPFTAADISGDLRVVVDLPSAKRDGTPPDYQISLTCQKVVLACERVFPSMRLEVVDRSGERLHPLRASPVKTRSNAFAPSSTGRSGTVCAAIPCEARPTRRSTGCPGPSSR